jgi:Flp pilus assembly protein TadB
MLILAGVGLVMSRSRALDWRPDERQLAPAILTVSLAAAVWLGPLAGLLALAGYTVYRRWFGFPSRSKPAVEARFYQELLTELQSGVGIRPALARTIAGFDQLDLSDAGRRLEAGVDMGAVVEGLAPVLTFTGDLAAVALELGADLGGDLRPVVADLAHAAGQLESVEREVTVQTAQARFSAVMVGVIPVAVAGILMITRGGLPAEPVGRTLVVAGLVFQLGGLATVGWMLRR